MADYDKFLESRKISLGDLEQKTNTVPELPAEKMFSVSELATMKKVSNAVRPMT